MSLIYFKKAFDGYLQALREQENKSQKPIYTVYTEKIEGFRIIVALDLYIYHDQKSNELYINFLIRTKNPRKIIDTLDWVVKFKKLKKILNEKISLLTKNLKTFLSKINKKTKIFLSGNCKQTLTTVLFLCHYHSLFSYKKNIYCILAGPPKIAIKKRCIQELINQKINLLILILKNDKITDQNLGKIFHKNSIMFKSHLNFKIKYWPIRKFISSIFNKYLMGHHMFLNFIPYILRYLNQNSKVR